VRRRSGSANGANAGFSRARISGVRGEGEDHVRRHARERLRTTPDPTSEQWLQRHTTLDPTSDHAWPHVRLQGYLNFLASIPRGETTLGEINWAFLMSEVPL